MQRNQVVNSGNELDFMPNLEPHYYFPRRGKPAKRDATMHFEHTVLLYTINDDSLMAGCET